MNATTETQQTIKKANCLSCNAQQPKESLVGNLCTVCHTLQGNNYTGQIVAEAKQQEIPEVTPESIKETLESIPAINTKNRMTLGQLQHAKEKAEVDQVLANPVISTYRIAGKQDVDIVLPNPHECTELLQTQSIRKVWKQLEQLSPNLFSTDEATDELLYKGESVNTWVDEGTLHIVPDVKVLERPIHNIDIEFKIDNKEETVEESPEETHTVFGIDLAAEGSESESARLETTSEEETEAEDNAGYKLNTLNTASCTGGSESSPVSTPQVSQNTSPAPEDPEHGVRHEAMKKQYEKQQRMNAAEDEKTNTCSDSNTYEPRLERIKEMEAGNWGRAWLYHCELSGKSNTLHACLVSELIDCYAGDVHLEWVEAAEEYDNIVLFMEGDQVQHIEPCWDTMGIRAYRDGFKQLEGDLTQIVRDSIGNREAMEQVVESYKKSNHVIDFAGASSSTDKALERYIKGVILKPRDKGSKMTEKDILRSHGEACAHKHNLIEDPENMEMSDPTDIYAVLEESEAAALNANGLTDEEDIALDKLLFLFPDSVRYMILEKLDSIGKESPDTSFPDEARQVLANFSNLIDTEIHDCVKHLEEMVVSGEVTDEVLEEMTQVLINDGTASTEPQEINIQENPNGDMSHVVDAFTYAASNMAEAASIPQNMLQKEEPESSTESTLEGADKYAEEIAMQAAKSSIDYEDLVYVCLVTLPDDTVDICASIDLTDLDSAARQLTTLLLEDASSELSPEVTKEFGNTLYISIIGGGVHKTKDLKHICGLYPTHAEDLLAEDGIITGEQMIRYTRALMLNGYRINYPFSKYIPWAEGGALLDFMDEVKTEGVRYARHGAEGYWYKVGTDIAEKR